MTNKKLFAMIGFVLAFALVLSTASFVSADKTVNYNVNYNLIEDNGTYSYTNTPITGVNATLYTCANAACTSIGPVVGRFYTSTNVLSIVFPEVLQSVNGYVIHATKEGYIGWEQDGVIRYGNGTVNSNTTFYMARMRNGFAPIMNLSVTEEVPTNRPIRVGFNVSVDANTYSAIQRTTTSNVPISATVQTLVSLEIKNSSGSVIYRDNQTLHIPYSTSMPVNFDYAGFSLIGQYNINVYTDVPDVKIVNSNRQAASANIAAINASARNYTYTLIQNLQFVPALPIQGDNVNFSFNYLSGYINSSNAYLPANTILNMTIIKDSSVISTNIVSVGSNGTYSFNRTFADAGFYRILIIGSPNDARGSAVYPSSQEVTFVINFNSTNNGTINNTVPVPNPNPDPVHHVTTTTVAPSGDGFVSYDSLPLITPTNSPIVLTKTETKSSGYRVWFAWLLAVTILLLIAVILIYVFKFVLAKE